MVYIAFDCRGWLSSPDPVKSQNGCHRQPSPSRRRFISHSIWFRALFQNRNRVGYRLFVCLAAVLINLGFVLFAVGQASRTANTSTDTRHSLDKVYITQILALSEQCRTALFDAVTRLRFKLKILIPVFFKPLLNRIRKSAAACKNSSEI